MNDPIQRSHRGNGDGMSTHGKLLQHGKPQRWEARSQPDAREGQAGLSGVADGFVVPGKPGNAGGGKGPEFKKDVHRGDGRGEWRKPGTSSSNGRDPEASSHLESTGHTGEPGAF